MHSQSEHDETLPARPGRRRHDQQVRCGWCGKSVTVPRRGRVPKWCSSACRQRAWQQKRAVQSDRSPVEVVQQMVEVHQGQKIVEKFVQVPVNARPKTGKEWADMLQKLAWSLSTNRLNEADVRMIEVHLYSVNAALDRRRREL